MKTTQLLAILIAAILPHAAIVAEDAGKTETTDQKQGQSSEMMGMNCMTGKGQMMSNWKEQDAELDKLVAEMNLASADKKLDAVAAVVTKLVEQRKAMHQEMQKMMSENEKDGMGMCQIMMGMDMGHDYGGDTATRCSGPKFEQKEPKLAKVGHLSVLEDTVTPPALTRMLQR